MRIRIGLIVLWVLVAKRWEYFFLRLWKFSGHSGEMITHDKVVIKFCNVKIRMNFSLLPFSKFQLGLVQQSFSVRSQVNSEHEPIASAKLTKVQCPKLIMITLGQHKSDNNDRMIQLTDVFCILIRYNGTSNICLQ